MARVDADEKRKKAAWSAAAHLGGKDLSLWTSAYPSGFQPYRQSHFNYDEWEAAGYDPGLHRRTTSARTSTTTTTRTPRSSRASPASSSTTRSPRTSWRKSVRRPVRRPDRCRQHRRRLGEDHRPDRPRQPRIFFFFFFFLKKKKKKKKKKKGGGGGKKKKKGAQAYTVSDGPVPTLSSVTTSPRSSPSAATACRNPRVGGHYRRGQLDGEREIDAVVDRMSERGGERVRPPDQRRLALPPERRAGEPGDPRLRRVPRIRAPPRHRPERVRRLDEEQLRAACSARPSSSRAACTEPASATTHFTATLASTTTRLTPGARRARRGSARCCRARTRSGPEDGPPPRRTPPFRRPPLAPPRGYGDARPPPSARSAPLVP